MDDKTHHEDNWHMPQSPQPPNPYDLERRIALLEQSTNTIKDELGKINTNIGKLVWIVMSAVVLAGINVIFNGAGGI